MTYPFPERPRSGPLDRDVVRKKFQFAIYRHACRILRGAQSEAVVKELKALREEILEEGEYEDLT